MARRKKRKTPRPTPAAKALDSFISGNKIPLKTAARALGVTHQALLSWFSGVSRPKNELRKAIEVWTNGAVTEDSWATDEEREALDAIRPFEPKDGKDAA